MPWGAAHLPAIQKQIEEWGFVETKRDRHMAVNCQNKPLIALLFLIDRLPNDPKTANP